MTGLNKKSRFSTFDAVTLDEAGGCETAEKDVGLAKKPRSTEKPRPPSKTKEILGHFGVYISGVQIKQLITIVGALVIRRFLGPLQMGIWSMLQIILTYAKYSTLGTSDATTREIPYYRGKKECGKADKVKDTVFSFSILTSLIVAIGLVIFTLLWRTQMRAEVFYGLLFVGMLIILQRVNNILIVLLRAHKEFAFASKQMVISAIVNIALIASLSYWFKIYGFLWATCLSFAFNICYIMSHRMFSFKFSLDWKQIIPLISYGFPLMILGVLGTIFRSIDKIMIVKMLGFEALGLYSIAVMAFNFANQIPISASVILVPHFQEKLGTTNNMRDLTGYISKSVYALSITIPIVIGLIWLASPFLIRLTLPNYTGGMGSLKYLLLGIYFVAVIKPYSIFLVGIKKHLSLLPVMVAVCLLSIIFNLVAIRRGYGISGVALATTVSLFLHFTIIYVFASRLIANVWQLSKDYLKIMFHFLFLILVLFILRSVIPSSDDSLSQVCLQCGVFCIIYLPFVITLNRRFDIIATIKKRFLRKNLA